jgi:hypothetical protein
METKMKIEIIITGERIAALLSSAIEGGDPVTTKSRGGWCEGVYWKSKRHNPPAGNWYADASNFRGAFSLTVHEYHEEDDSVTRHKLDEEKARHGLELMAAAHPSFFAQITGDNIDAPCADAFLQLSLFSEMKYG